MAAELILGFIFASTAQLFYKKSGIDFRSIIKGFIERLFLFAALISNFPHALALFGALKVATRIKRTPAEGDDENAFNDFYLIGNFISVLVVFGYVFLYKNYLNQS